MKGLITDEYPRWAVLYWAYCVGGRDKIKVYVDDGVTTFQNKYGATIVFNYCMDFTDAKVYKGGTFTLEELVGDEDEDMYK